MTDLNAVLEYTLYGDPRAWQRPRGHGKIHFTPQPVLDEMQRHRDAATAARPIGWDHQDPDAEYGVNLTFYVGTVKSGPRKGKRKRLDMDNAVKLVFDGLTGAAWLDDEQVSAHYVWRKIDSDEPRTEVEIWRIERARECA